jgi:hypothetical protein
MAIYRNSDSSVRGLKNAVNKYSDKTKVYIDLNGKKFKIGGVTQTVERGGSTCLVIKAKEEVSEEHFDASEFWDDLVDLEGVSDEKFNEKYKD